jgi:predicted Zn-dependent peptidase
MNAFTSKELTSFYIKIPDYHLPLAIDLLADIFLHSRFAREDIEKEKSVVLQEINLTEDTPDDYIQEFLEAQFWNGHRLGQPILGDRGSGAHFSREGVVDFFGRHYRAGRGVVTAAGRVDHDDLVARVQEAFGAMEDVAAVKADDGEPGGGQAAVLERQLEQVHLMLATMAASVVSEQRYSSFLLNAVLGGSMSSRLFRRSGKNGLWPTPSPRFCPIRGCGDVHCVGRNSPP